MKTFFLALLLAAACRATIITGTTCSASDTLPPFHLSSSGENSCGASSPLRSGASASVSATTETLSQFSIAASTFLSTNTINSVVIVPGGNGIVTGSATASANSTVFQVFTTAGPQRSGLIKETANFGTDPGFDGIASAAIQVGSFTYAGDRPHTFCCSILFPFELGQPFLFKMDAFSESFSFGLSDGTTGTRDMTNATTQFFEADGVTPVEILDSATPEPAALTLLLLGGILMFVWNCRQNCGEFQAMFVTPVREGGDNTV